MKCILKVNCEAIQYDGENRPLLEVLLKNVPCSIFRTNNIIYIRSGVWRLEVAKTNWVVVLETGEIMVLTSKQFEERLSSVIQNDS